MNLENLSKIIKEKKLNMNAVSAGTGIAPTVLSDWKNGRAVPTVAKLEKVADFLDCSIDYLIGRTDIPNTLEIPRATLNQLTDIIADSYNSNDEIYVVKLAKSEKCKTIFDK